MFIGGIFAIPKWVVYDISHIDPYDYESKPWYPNSTRSYSWYSWMFIPSMAISGT